MRNCRLIVAAGVAKTFEDIERLRDVPVDVITLGSFTLEPRAGNEGRTFAWTSQGTVNRRGLPNAGVRGAPLDAMCVALRARDISPVVSVAPLAMAEAGSLVDAVLDSCTPDAIEINLGCPNADHEPWSYDESNVAIVAVCATIARRQRGRGSVPLWYKLSPFANPAALRRVIDQIVLVHRAIDDPRFGLVLTNTLPGARALGARGDALLDGDGTGGGGGEAVHAVALQNVDTTHHALIEHGLREHVTLVGTGGVRGRATTRAFRQRGADAVGVCSLLWGTGVTSDFRRACARRIYEETRS